MRKYIKVLFFFVGFWAMYTVIFESFKPEPEDKRQIEYMDVTLEELLAHPGNYEGLYVRTSGIFPHRNEVDAIFPTKVEAERKIYEKAVGFDTFFLRHYSGPYGAPTPDLYDQMKIEGRFGYNIKYNDSNAFGSITLVPFMLTRAHIVKSKNMKILQF